MRIYIIEYNMFNKCGYQILTGTGLTIRGSYGESLTFSTVKKTMSFRKSWQEKTMTVIG